MAITAGQLRRELGRLREDFPTEAEALRRRAFWRLARRFTPLLAVDRDELRFVVSTSDLVLGRRLFCYPQTPEADIARAMAALRRIPGLGDELPGAHVLEVGANIGSHTVELIRHYGIGSVVAIEPDPENCRLLRQNVMLNGTGDLVDVFELALSDRDGQVELELSETNSGDHRVRVGGAAPAGAEGRRATTTVRAAAFDSLVASGELDLERLKLVWMDAQGHEGHILSGGRRLLESGVPVMMEYWPYGLRRAGGLDLLHELVTRHYDFVVDIAPRCSEQPQVIPAEHLPLLEAESGWAVETMDPEAATDLILARWPAQAPGPLP